MAAQSRGHKGGRMLARQRAPGDRPAKVSKLGAMGHIGPIAFFFFLSKVNKVLLKYTHVHSFKH